MKLNIHGGLNTNVTFDNFILNYVYYYNSLTIYLR
jgi:hypothetical protein